MLLLQLQISFASFFFLPINLHQSYTKILYSGRLQLFPAFAELAYTQCRVRSQRPLSQWKLISKFMLICSFCKKISSVNSQLSKEINFEILLRNLEHVLFCKILWKKFHLWSAVIGQSASVYKHRYEASYMAFESLFPV